MTGHWYLVRSVVVLPLLPWCHLPVTQAFPLTSRLNRIPLSSIHLTRSRATPSGCTLLLIRQAGTTDVDTGGGHTSSFEGGGDDNKLLPQAINIVCGSLGVLRELEAKANEEDYDDDEDYEENETKSSNNSTDISHRQHHEERQPIFGNQNYSQLSISNHTALHDLPKQLERNLEAFQLQLKKFQRRRFRVFRVSTIVKSLSAWAFDVCSTTAVDKAAPWTIIKKNTDRVIDARAFYSGILLIHLHLAKFVGVAACHPPDREQIEELFRLADADRSGYLNQEEFTNAAIVTCAPITSRVVTYYALIFAILPWVVSTTMKACQWVVTASHLSTKFLYRVPPPMVSHALAVTEWWVGRTLSIVIFSVLVPLWFGRVDQAFRQWATRRTSNKLWWLEGMSNEKRKKETRSTWLSDFYLADWRWSRAKEKK